MPAHVRTHIYTESAPIYTYDRGSSDIGSQIAMKPGTVAPPGFGCPGRPDHHRRGDDGPTRPSPSLSLRVYTYTQCTYLLILKTRKSEVGARVREISRCNFSRGADGSIGREGERTIIVAKMTGSKVRAVFSSNRYFAIEGGGGGLIVFLGLSARYCLVS